MSAIIEQQKKPTIIKKIKPLDGGRHGNPRWPSRITKFPIVLAGRGVLRIGDRCGPDRHASDKGSVFEKCFGRPARAPAAELHPDPRRGISGQAAPLGHLAQAASRPRRPRRGPWHSSRKPLCVKPSHPPARWGRRVRRRPPERRYVSQPRALIPQPGVWGPRQPHGYGRTHCLAPFFPTCVFADGFNPYDRCAILSSKSFSCPRSLRNN